VTSPRTALAVTVDLDDTLFPQHQWLDGAWAAVATRGAELGLPGHDLLAALRDVAADGSDRGGIVDRALERLDLPLGHVPELVAAFAGHAPDRLDPYPGAAAALRSLAATLPVVCVTDGNPRIQHAKIAALGIGDAFRAVVVSDALEMGGERGRALRKPHPAPFRHALDVLGLPAVDVVHIGDRPAKDVAGAAAVGRRCVRVTTGEYAHLPDLPGTWRTAGGFAEAAGLLLEAVAV
jgi:putative hydrolase of the HAD superfamily